MRVIGECARGIVGGPPHPGARRRGAVGGGGDRPCGVSPAGGSPRPGRPSASAPAPWPAALAPAAAARNDRPRTSWRCRAARAPWGTAGSPTVRIPLDKAWSPGARRIGDKNQGFVITLSAVGADRRDVAGPTSSASPRRRRVKRSRTPRGGGSTAGRGPASRGRVPCPPACPPGSRPGAPRTGTALRIATDAGQLLGGYAYPADLQVGRVMREVEVARIVEGAKRPPIRCGGASSPACSCAPSRRAGLPAHGEQRMGA
ncbi:acyl-CoA dehydrogenase family protein [Streptomyces sp. NPDC044780]|uniref:acyl-CoA dehydrogenase family protein n=1 Tax=unclassified Streptomyces TaxID=2593676 RepID=UPI0033D78F67